jgi:type IV secretory pathway VirJ component
MLPNLCKAQLLDTFHPWEFGPVQLFTTDPTPSAFVVLFSGESGIEQDDTDAVTTLTNAGAAVALIDTREALRRLNNINEKSGECTNIFFPVDGVSQSAQQTLKVSRYLEPILLGRGVGGTLAYVVLAQSQPLAFSQGLSVDFTATLPLKIHLCGLDSDFVDNQTQQLKPTYPLFKPWRIAVTKGADAAQKQFAIASGVTQHVSTALLAPPAPLSVLYLAAVQSDTSVLSDNTQDLPLVEVSNASERDTLIIIWSGDGGWRDIDRTLGDLFAKQKYAVLGVDTLRYFWSYRGPDDVAQDLARMIRHYSEDWHVQHVALVGYSFGADVLPFLYTRLPTELQHNVALISLLAPLRAADFEIHMSGWLGAEPTRTALPVAPEVAKIPPAMIQCIYGTEEADGSLCTEDNNARFQRLGLSGGHHFDEDYDKLARVITDAIESRRQKNAAKK